MRQWAASHDLGVGTLRFFHVDGDALPAQVDGRRTLAENRTRIEGVAVTCSGVHAAQRLADALRRCPEDDGGILDGMLNLGASRIGHADWIEAIYARTGYAEFVTARLGSCVAWLSSGTS